MIACDNNTFPFGEWFHFKCVQLTCKHMETGTVVNNVKVLPLMNNIVYVHMYDTCT